MQVDPHDFRRHYASLSDEGLRSLDRAKLTAFAQKCYDEEVVQRDLDLAQRQLEPNELDSPAEPDWLAEAACAISFMSFPGSTSAADAANARSVLQAAGIPCHISIHELDPEPAPDDDPPQRFDYQLMVPGALSLQATSVLDREIFNADVESEWAAHFQALSDDEFRSLSPEVICAGLEDRILRLKRAHAAELNRRRLAGDAA